jgi:hypothetical protein
MSDDKKKPWGDAYAIKPGRESTDGEVSRDVWVPLGPVWQSEQGNFSLTLDSEPIHWRNPNVERRVVITKRQAATTTPTTSNTSRGRK